MKLQKRLVWASLMLALGSLTVPIYKISEIFLVPCIAVGIFTIVTAVYMIFDKS